MNQQHENIRLLRPIVVVPPAGQRLLRHSQRAGPQERVVLPGGFGSGDWGNFGGAAAAAPVAGGAVAALAVFGLGILLI